MFKVLRRRLLFSYMGVIIGIFSISTLAVYRFIAHNLYKQLDQQMLTIADAAAHSLELIKKNSTLINSKAPRILDNDGDLDIPWQDLRENYQGVEWFDAKGSLLGKAGSHLPLTPLNFDFHTHQYGKLRSITIPVYRDKTKKQLQGFIRVSESIEDLEAELNRLVWGLSCGGITAFTLSGIGSWWLTKQSLKPVEESFEKLKQFTADASHELRSPLTAIKTSVDVIMNHPERIHPADVKKLQSIASGTNQMARLVEDLLLLARTDKFPTNSLDEWVLIPLDEFLEDLVELLQSQAEIKGINLKAEITHEVFVKGDVAGLKRLFSNLLENALQYTSTGGSVSVSIVEYNKFVTINIQDTGIGITPEDIPFIFNRFWRADKARSRRSGGLGLGLAIAQTVATNHGGEITVSSQIGIGSCFQISLPIATD